MQQKIIDGDKSKRNYDAPYCRDELESDSELLKRICSLMDSNIFFEKMGANEIVE